MKICYWGTYDADYSRNVIIISGLGNNGIEVVECHIDVWGETSRKLSAAKISNVMTVISTFLNLSAAYLKLFLRFLLLKKIDVIIIGYTGHIDVFIGKILSKLKGIPLVFDAYLSLHDSLICDRKVINKSSLKAYLLHGIDKYSCKLADVVLLDTNEHIEYFVREFGIPKTKFRRIYISADDNIFHFNGIVKSQTQPNKIFKVLHFGKYIPLHGLQYVLQAAEILENDSILFQFIGSGQEYPSIRSTAEALSLKNIEFIEFIPQSLLVDYIQEADICLGIFGDTEKAKRVIPNKIYECIAMKKAVITGNSPAIRELFIHGKNIWLCEMANAKSLAEAILFLKQNNDIVNGIASNAYNLYKECLAPKYIGKEIITIVKSII